MKAGMDWSLALLLQHTTSPCFATICATRLLHWQACPLDAGTRWRTWGWGVKDGSSQTQRVSILGLLEKISKIRNVFFLTYPKQSYFSESWNEDWWALLWCWMVAKVVDNKQVKRWWCQWLGTGTRWVWKVRLCYFMSISSNFVQLVGKKQDWHKILYCCWILYTWYRSCLWPTQLPTFCPSHLW